MIEVRHLKKSFGNNVILQDINFTVNDGESVVIIGGSGCGKSTLLRCLNHLIVPEEGEILFNGKNILDKKTNIDEYRRHVGMVYQHFNLFEHLNIMENMILAPMKVLHMPQDEAIARAEQLLDQVGLLSRKYRMPSALSGGQKQRVAIARTLMMQPDMILFDEPTSALDPTMVDEVESVIRNLIDGGMTSVIVTHEMRFAENISDRTIFLAEKSIYEEGPSSVIFQKPERELTRQFIYRSRLFTRELASDTLDYYGLMTELCAFLRPYGCDVRQQTAVLSFGDEILLALIRHSRTCTLELLCSETGKGHKLTAVFPNLAVDPMTMIDDLGVKILQTCTQSISSEKNADGRWAVTVVF